MSYFLSERCSLERRVYESLAWFYGGRGCRRMCREWLLCLRDSVCPLRYRLLHVRHREKDHRLHCPHQEVALALPNRLVLTRGSGGFFTLRSLVRRRAFSPFLVKNLPCVARRSEVGLFQLCSRCFCRTILLFQIFLECSYHVVLWTAWESCTCRNKTSDDDVFLQT